MINIDDLYRNLEKIRLDPSNERLKELLNLSHDYYIQISEEFNNGKTKDYGINREMVFDSLSIYMNSLQNFIKECPLDIDHEKLTNMINKIIVNIGKKENTI